MPSDTMLEGRCYCGRVHLTALGAPLTVAYCHCSDCRRVTGAPVAAFAAFGKAQLTWNPELDEGLSRVEGVRRWFCRDCGTPLAAYFDYLPGQTYVPIGLFDDATNLSPESHSHAESQLPWLHLQDDLPRSAASGRDRLNETLKCCP